MDGENHYAAATSLELDQRDHDLIIGSLQQQLKRFGIWSQVEA